MLLINHDLFRAVITARTATNPPKTTDEENSHGSSEGNVLVTSTTLHTVVEPNYYLFCFKESDVSDDDGKNSRRNSVSLGAGAGGSSSKSQLVGSDRSGAGALNSNRGAGAGAGVGLSKNDSSTMDSLRADVLRASSQLTALRHQLSAATTAETSQKTENVRMLTQLKDVTDELRDARHDLSERSKASEAAAASSQFELKSLTALLSTEVATVADLRTRLASLTATQDSLKQSAAASEVGANVLRTEIEGFQRQLSSVNARNADLERQLAFRDLRSAVPLDGVGAAHGAHDLFAAANLRGGYAVGQAAPGLFVPPLLRDPAVPQPLPRPPQRCNKCRRVGHRTRECTVPVPHVWENRGSRSAGLGN